MRCGLLACALLLLAACDLSVDPNDGWNEVLGQLGERDVVIPETATAGTPFRITIATTGDGCFRGGRTVVVQTPTLLDIEPRDFTPTPPPHNCNSIGYRFPHHVDATFNQPGVVRVVVRGIRQWIQTGPLDTVIVQRDVTIR